MDRICLPVRYEGLSVSDVQAHLRHCANNLGNMDRAEFLLPEAGLVVPVVKHIYRTKPSTLVFLARSGSIERAHLGSLRDQLASEDYDLKLSFTKKRKRLSRIAVSLALDEPMYPAKAMRIFEFIATQLKSPWPQIMAAGYGVRSDGPGLPGEVKIDYLILNASRKLGFAIGTIVRKVTS